MCVYYGKVISVGQIISDKNFFFFEFTEKLENEFIRSHISDFSKERLEEVRRLMIEKTEENMSNNTGSYYKEKCEEFQQKCQALELELIDLRNHEDKKHISFLKQRNEELLTRLQEKDQLEKEIDQLAESIQGLEGEKTELNAKLKLSETKIAVIEDLLVSYAYKLENYRRMKGEK